MLVLGRKVGEAITIEWDPGLEPDTALGRVFADGPITIWITDVSHGQVKVGVDAPRSLSVVRGELEYARGEFEKER